MQAVPAGKKVHRCTKCAATFDSLLELGEHVLVEMNDGVTSPPFPYPRGYEPPAPVQPATQQPQPELPCDTPTEERPQSSFERPSMEPSQEEHLGPEKAPDAYAAVFPCPKCGDCFGTKESTLSGTTDGNTAALPAPTTAPPDSRHYTSCTT
ncbi:uncharacterized protein LOC144138802 [Haemaphysalis longicornis]